MEHDVSTILVLSRSLRISSVDNITCKETNFSSHFDSISTSSDWLETSEMLHEERLLEGKNGLVGVGVIDSGDFAFLSLSAFERSGSDSDEFSYFPVNLLLESDFGCSFSGSDLHGSPFGVTLNTVHF